MYARDPESKALINTDDAAYRSILIRRQMQKQTTEIVAELKTIKTEMAAIKQMLINAASNGQNNG